MPENQTITLNQNTKTSHYLTQICFGFILGFLAFNLQAADVFNNQTCNSLFKDKQLNQICHSAIKGDAKARYTMAKFFTDPRTSFPKKMNYAYFWHLKLARQILKENLNEPAYTDILYNTGVLYADGLGTPANGKKALYWFKQAAERGHSMAMTRLFLAYENAQGTEKNTQKAQKWLQKAIELKNPEAQILMAQQLMQGSGVPKDIQKGVSFLKEAAQEDSAKANYILGKYYLMAPEMQNPPHLTEAKQYFGNSCKLHFLIGCKRYYDLDNPSQTLPSKPNKSTQTIDFK